MRLDEIPSYSFSGSRIFRTTVPLNGLFYDSWREEFDPSAVRNRARHRAEYLVPSIGYDLLPRATPSRAGRVGKAIRESFWNVGEQRSRTHAH